MNIRSFLLAAVCVLNCLTYAGAAANQVYRWVDKDGKVHYSSTPPAATEAHPEKINVQPAQGFSMPAPTSVPAQSQPQSVKPSTDGRVDKAKAYDADVQIRGQECADLQRQLDALADDASLTATERASKERVVMEQMKDACP